MKKIKILHVPGSLGMGGVETVTMNIIRGLNPEKYEIDVLLFDPRVGEFEKELVELGGRIIRIDNPKEGYLRYYRNLKKIAQFYGPYDIIHTHPLFNSGFVVKAFSKHASIRITHAHDNLKHIDYGLPQKIYQYIMRKLINKYTTVKLACSEDAGKYLFGTKSFQKNGTVVLNGIDVKKFVYDDLDRKSIKKRLNLKDEYVIGHVGRFEKQKNQLFLIDVFSKVKLSLPNSKLILIGDGSMRKVCENRAKQLGLEDDILFMGTINSPEKLFSIMDVFVLPSLHEGLGIVLIEAQANGLPCIAQKGIVPKEAKILDTFDFLDYGATLDDWVKSIIDMRGQKRILKATEVVRSHGYDVEEMPKKIELIYLSNYRESTQY